MLCTLRPCNCVLDMSLMQRSILAWVFFVKFCDSISLLCCPCAGMIARNLDLNRARYKKTAAYGHFGREPTDVFTWEKVIDLKPKA